MCDPITLITGALGALGSSQKAPKPPAAKLPAPPTQDAKEDTGATVALGGELDDATTDRTKTSSTTSTKKAGSTVRSAGRSGINIL